MVLEMGVSMDVLAVVVSIVIIAVIVWVLAGTVVALAFGRAARVGDEMLLGGRLCEICGEEPAVPGRTQCLSHVETVNPEKF
jgi:hypothetical protein